MQISGKWLIEPFHKLVMSTTGLASAQAVPLTQGWYIALSFAIALILSLFLTSRDKTFWDIYQGKKETIPLSIMWGIIGFFLSFHRPNDWCSYRNGCIWYPRWFAKHG